MEPLPGLGRRAERRKIEVGLIRGAALNAPRRDKTRNPAKFMADGDVGDQIAGFFDGVQIDPASTETTVSRGYAV